MHRAIAVSSAPLWPNKTTPGLWPLPARAVLLYHCGRAKARMQIQRERRARECFPHAPPKMRKEMQKRTKLYLPASTVPRASSMGGEETDIRSEGAESNSPVHQQKAACYASRCGTTDSRAVEDSGVQRQRLHPVPLLQHTE